MTGPEHYEEAERCLLENGCEYGCPHSGCEHEMRIIARAQAHATLALAAAAGLGMGRETLTTPSPARIEWFRVAGPEGSAS
jgi:hypothetical protein